MTWFFTADLHFDHTNIMKHCERPWTKVEDMNQNLIENYNSVVKNSDNVVIAGDITLHTNRKIVEEKFLNRLNGNKIYLKGNHDYWLKEKRYLYHRNINGQFIAVSHYPMRSWKNSTHGSWNLHGHSHGKLVPFENQYDVGVDNNNYFPISFEQIKEIIKCQKNTQQIKSDKNF